MIFTTTKISKSYWKISFNNPPINLFDTGFSKQLMVLMDELDSFVDNFARRIASFDKNAITSIKLNLGKHVYVENSSNPIT